MDHFSGYVQPVCGENLGGGLIGSDLDSIHNCERSGEMSLESVGYTLDTGELAPQSCTRLLALVVVVDPTLVIPLTC